MKSLDDFPDGTEISIDFSQSVTWNERFPPGTTFLIKKNGKNIDLEIHKMIFNGIEYVKDYYMGNRKKPVWLCRKGQMRMVLDRTKGEQAPSEAMRREVEANIASAEARAKRINELDDKKTNA